MGLEDILTEALDDTEEDIERILLCDGSDDSDGSDVVETYAVTVSTPDDDTEDVLD